MDQRQRRDQTDPTRERDASRSTDDDRSEGSRRRVEQDRPRPPLTPREREERWPVG